VSSLVALKSLLSLRYSSGCSMTLAVSMTDEN
jgi:hypothetical protein